MTWVGLKRLDEHFQVSIEPGETFLGRGPLLEITAKNISRKHARLCVGENGDCSLTCLHTNSIYVLKTGDDWTELEKDKMIVLDNGDEVKFLQNSFHYKISISTSADEGATEKKSETNFSTMKDMEPSHLRVINTEEVIGPAPTGLKVIKKRKLPDWMQNSSPGTAKKLSPDKAPRAKENKTPDIYSANVKLINSAWKSEKIIEPEGGKLDGCGDGGKTEDTSAVSNIMKDNNEQEALHDLEVDPTEPSTSKVKREIPVQEMKKVEVPVNVFPVLVTSNDLIDSDDEDDQGKENIEHKAKVELGKNLRPACRFGLSCYRKNPQHKFEEAHPGDDDYKDPNDEESDQEKPECEFGLDCYRKNPAHRKEYKHTRKPQPKRVAKVGAKVKSDTDSDDSFINDEDDGWEPVDDSDEDEDWAPSLSPDYLRHADLSKNRTMY